MDTPTPQRQTSDRCACGHRRNQHVRYVNGTNRHGSRFVCTKDGCTHWRDCDLDEQNEDEEA